MHAKQAISAASVLAISLGLSTVVRAGGDAAAANAQSLACEACHVSDAVTGDIPRLAGLREAYITKQLQAFKSGSRKDRLMNAIAGELSDTDIGNLAAFWNRRPAGGDTTVSSQVAAIKKSKMVFPPAFPQGFLLFAITNKEDRHVVAKAFVNTVAFEAVNRSRPRRPHRRHVLRHPQQY
jgi:cytochrome c553